MKTSTTRFYNYFGKEALIGGLNTSDNPVFLSSTQLSLSENILVSNSLSRKKRGAFEAFHTGSFASTASYPALASPIRGIIDYWRYASATGLPTQNVFLHSSNKVWSIPNRTAAATNRTGALVLNTSGIPSYAVFDDVLYFCSSQTSDGYNKWTGEAATAQAATGPSDGNGKVLQIHQGRMWMGGVPGFPFRLYYSQSLDPESWSGGSGGDAAGSLDLTAYGDPEGITAIFPSFQGSLYVATRKTIFEIQGTDASNFVVSPKTRGIGCIGQASMAITPNDVLFCSDRGVHSLVRTLSGTDQVSVNFVSQDIQKTWTTGINRALLAQCAATWIEDINTYVLSAPSAGQSTNDTIFTYNTIYGIWHKWTGVQARSLAPILVNSDQKFVVGREDGQISLYNESATSDMGSVSGFGARFRTGTLYPGSDFTTEKRFVSLTVLTSATRPANFQITWTVDGTKTNSRTIPIGSSDSLLGSTFVMGVSKLGGSDNPPIHISLDEVGYGIQIEFAVSGTGNFENYGFILEVEDVNPKYT